MHRTQAFTENAFHTGRLFV